MTDRRYVTVCDKCLRACCWQGEFMCDNAIGAGTFDLDIRYLQARALEHPSYWDVCDGCGQRTYHEQDRPGGPKLWFHRHDDSPVCEHHRPLQRSLQPLRAGAPGAPPAEGGAVRIHDYPSHQPKHQGRQMNNKTIAATLIAAAALTGCASDADVVSSNLSKAADQFEVSRRIIFYNGITDKYMLTIEGRCSISHQDRQLEVTCKTQGGEYKKHFLGLSDNVTYVAEQLEAVSADANHYRVIFKPEVIVPDVDRP